VLGIFCRLWHRDGKIGYLDDLPLVLSYVLDACQRYPELVEFGRWLEWRVASELPLANAREKQKPARPMPAARRKTKPTSKPRRKSKPKKKVATRKRAKSKTRVKKRAKSVRSARKVLKKKVRKVRRKVAARRSAKARRPARRRHK